MKTTSHKAVVMSICPLLSNASIRVQIANGAGNMFSRLGDIRSVRHPAWFDVTMRMRKLFNERCGKPFAMLESPNQLRRTHLVTLLPPTCYKLVMTFARSKSSLVTKDVSTTMIYTHVLNRGDRGVLSPIDR